ncbi:glutamine-hydrolyzing GMP synthase [Capnocytophaga canimorsus]|uniref:GMP synthase [glutamine-hydrolyzing] n=1 Tax=Capnocytophaga canimorsus TaxID=28188 RepID=A0A0B7HNJ8_9FLAO|nr:glutamine-hydrolyzing GMP synthase [Capnocytophaga canimorsus]ATA76770.1 GMP synthase (glutamine-hydrolyzing) [Capnocytophaga canimorsus]PJI84110.1 GMP synthase (glutamine-hydrolysing) [Capnocytophaga canimorsus]CEN40865.1 GMP synthetase (glutamine aminotransferase) [Capnocytophaga canimorsus]STA71963.1 GMP synthase [glutamine-hydrolyzing] [Capnocytophaga canimorsus]GIM55818.1 GMP synthase [glutamine-hydrolyzing] [Capnocytophaga canimorsus]
MNSVLILDFGSQYTQLIARRVRELNIYCEIHPYNHLPENVGDFSAVILSGSPFSVRNEEAPHPDLSQIRGKKPLLGVCYGAQYLAHFNGGEVAPSNIREYGRANLTFIKADEPFFKNIPQNSQVWMSHSDTIKQLPQSGVCLASTKDVANAAYRIEGETTYAIQFHPEVYHSTHGKQLLANFLIEIAGITPSWTPDNFVEMTVKNLKEQIGDEQVVLGLSGGVDSTVAAVLLNKAIGKQLHCIFVNNGLLRKNEFQNVLKQYEGMGLNVKGVDASERFLQALKEVSDPEQKRKIIGRVFVEVFDDESQKVENAKWLGQGTIYPDVIESISVKGPSATIKSHHNVGGLPDFMKLKVVEPLRMLFKDEVRRVGASLGIDPELLGRHPFPGPGLAIRILGDITAEKVQMLQEVDAIFINGLKKHQLYDKVWQAGAILLPVNSVGVMGDERTYEKCVALRAVESTDGMTADWVHLPYEFLQQISNEIINKVKGVNRVVYDISSKPPATIEWE